MRQLNLDLGEKSYPIYIGQGSLSQPELLTEHISGKQIMIVTNTTVAPLYLAQVKSCWVIIKFQALFCLMVNSTKLWIPST